LRRRRRRIISAAALAAAALAFGTVGLSWNWAGPEGQDAPGDRVVAASPSDTVTASGTSTPAAPSAADPGAPLTDSVRSDGSATTSADTATLPADVAAAESPSLALSTVNPVPGAELVRLRVFRPGNVLIDAESSGLARYSTSTSCEVPAQPCYDAPFLDKVARIELGAPPEVPGTQTTFITGHSNRYRPDDPARGVFSHLQDVRTGDVLVLTTTTGIFTYSVTKTLSVPFDQLTTNPDVVSIRKDTVVAISCVIAPDLRSYLGNFVVVGTLRGSVRI
jgi:LPXTG-site transpeptidase (sortase) family protein